MTAANLWLKHKIINPFNHIYQTNKPITIIDRDFFNGNDISSNNQLKFLNAKQNIDVRSNHLKHIKIT